MKKDSAMAIKDESAPSSDMHADHMMPNSLVLTGSSDLKKHVGHKVTGLENPPNAPIFDHLCRQFLKVARQIRAGI